MARRLPTLRDLAQIARGRAPQSRRGRATLQERPLVSRRGPRQAFFGPDELEARATQGIDATLPERIVHRELLRRRVAFEFQTSFGGGLHVAGVSVDFLIIARNPIIALEVLSDWNRPPLGSLHYEELKAALLEGAGYRYAGLWDELDIYPSRERLEQRLDEILGTDSLGYQAVPDAPAPAFPPASMTPGPEGFSGGVPLPKLKEEDDVTDLAPLWAAIQALQAKVQVLDGQLASHGSRHNIGGIDQTRDVTNLTKWDYDNVVSNLATQRIAYWDSFDGLGGAIGASAGVYERYEMGGQAGTLQFYTDTTTGRPFYRTQGTGTLGEVNMLFLRGETNVVAFRAPENWEFKALLRLEQAGAGGTQDFYAGFRADLLTGLKDGIYFRSSNAGNYFLVCRSAGVETTVDLGVAPSATIMRLLEFRITQDGGKVQSYLNGLPAGAPITSNIPQGNMEVVILCDNRVGTPTSKFITRCYGWGWKGDLVA